jgi:hypothetical protein
MGGQEHIYNIKIQVQLDRPPSSSSASSSSSSSSLSSSNSLTHSKSRPAFRKPNTTIITTPSSSPPSRDKSQITIQHIFGTRKTTSLEDNWEGRQASGVVSPIRSQESPHVAEVDIVVVATHVPLTAVESIEIRQAA